MHPKVKAAIMMKKVSVALVSAAILTTFLVGCRKWAKPSTRPAATKPTTAATQKLSPAPAATNAIDEEHLKRAQTLINSGIGFLLAVRDDDGGWSFGGGNVQKPAATALALKTLLGHPDFDSKSPAVEKAFKVLLGYRQKDGGVYDPKQGYRTYTTCTAVMAFVAAKDPRYNSAIRDAEKHLRGVQIKPGDETPDGRTIKAGDPEVGGVGYGENGVPNLSVLSFWTDAMYESGVSASDPAMQRAVEFLTSLQNDSEENPRAIAREGADDGGFPYDLKTSKAGPGPGGKGLRSYGSMTYAGFKSLLYAGVSKKDSRVKAAFEWIRRYWRLDTNPNMPRVQSQEGLYYYYHVFAKALRAWGEPVITDTKGREHNWRHELIDALGERIGPDGSWMNEADRWEEGSKVLVTCYAVLALEEALKK